MSKVVEFGCVDCPTHGYQTLTWAEYDMQLGKPDDSWRCPICDTKSEWIDQDDMEYDDGPPF